MKKAFFGLALLAAFGTAFAADAVWTLEGGKGPKGPAYWYQYTYGSGASIDTSYSATVGKTVSFKASASSEGGAGYGFTWAQTKSGSKYVDSPISLSAYKGVCITYSATNPVRMAFKQPSISDANYFGINLAASTDLKTQFIAFSDLAQESWSSSTWNVDDQTGVQFGYSKALASEYGTTSTLVLTSIVLGSCPTAPEVLEPYKSNMANADGVDSTSLNEPDTLKLKLSEIFTDEDGDTLAVSCDILNLNKGAVSLLNSDTVFGLGDTLLFVPKANLDSGTALVTLTAKDASNSAVYKLLVITLDADNAPVAVADKYSVKEDSSLTVAALNSILANDYDVDGDLFELESHTEPSHGALTLDAFQGTFTYVPEADYCGTDSWTYRLKEIKAEGALVGEWGTVSISVTCVNDAPTVTVIDSSYIRSLEYEEDFAGEEVLTIPATAIVFEDVDGDVLTKGVYTDGNISASYMALGSYHIITLSSVEDFNGTATVTLYATDGRDTAKVVFPVTITPVPDNPKAFDDTYTMYEDSTVAVSADSGVLKNDVNPDDKSDVLQAYLKTAAEHGSVELELDGSFTYTPDADYFGPDSFSYFVVNSAGDTSNVAQVLLDVLDMNDPPVVVVDTVKMDTLTKNEDFTSAIVFTAAVTKTWFTDPDGDPIYLSVSSDDGKLNPSISSGRITLKSVKDSTGDAYVTVTATDSISGETSFRIHVYLTPVNDKPVAVKDTIVVMETSGFSVEVDLDSIFSDPDGDALAYELFSAASVFSAEINGSILTVTPANDTLDIAEKVYMIRVKASDSSGLSLTAPIYFDIGGTFTGFVPKAFSKSISWERAITASRGTAKLYDLNGHLLWSGNLPASAADVRAVASRVSGKTLLRVNGFHYMLNSESLR